MAADLREVNRPMLSVRGQFNEPVSILKQFEGNGMAAAAQRVVINSLPRCLTFLPKVLSGTKDVAEMRNVPAILLIPVIRPSAYPWTYSSPATY